MPDRGLHLDLTRDPGLALGLELHLEFSLDRGRLREELRGGLRGRGLARLWRLRRRLDVHLQRPVELRLEAGLRGGGRLDLGLEWSLNPSGTLDLWEGLVWKLHLRMDLCLDLRVRLELRSLLKLDADLGMDLALCLGLEGLNLLNLAKVLHLDLSADLSRDSGRSLDLDVRLARARHDRRHGKTLKNLRARRLNNWNLRSLDVGNGQLRDGDFRLNLCGCNLRDLRNL